MNKSLKAIMLSAAVSGLLGGGSIALNAATTPTSVSAGGNAILGVSTAAAQSMVSKHSCKGKNDCKGQGGCKSSDNGCKGKNSCKGKGGCATDGSNMPK